MKKLLYILLSLILLLSTVSCQSSDDRPISVTETFHGCEYTLTIDKNKYSLEDTITATVTLENKSDKAVGLYSTDAGHYLDGIDFYENGEFIYHYSEPTNESDVICTRLFSPGESLTYTKVFTPVSPVETGKPAADVSAEWKLIAKVSIIPEPSEDFVENSGDEEFEAVSLEIVVPH